MCSRCRKPGRRAGLVVSVVSSDTGSEGAAPILLSVKKRETTVVAKWCWIEGVTLKLYPRNVERDKMVARLIRRGMKWMSNE
jgi:hypothetical protein